MTTVAWKTVERRARALVSRRSGTSVGHIERIAGFPSAAEEPLAKESARNGQSVPAPETLTRRRSAVIAASMRSDAM